ncbi:hypothetical protein NNX28_16895 [Arthrobacter sp. zg-Y859]|uniref:Uncharacterized protein n=1 Tax=Arthrobacter jinronghuae TaxID=2964609 RepID=A0ABT1NWW2_9MICC|nr:hypothetical protein [Arthrobacter jinronghuae]MCQ1951597.1 hypothetical protein [Arthrobacter jinronghuae]UWX79688.1 hypothetical protein N2K98_05685 [Arthrobacter jinronghuae]
MSTLTDRQQKALEQAERRIEVITGTDLGEWHIAYQPESRPGRGHDLSAWASDGEHMATQYLDPYGNGALVVYSIDLIHNDSDEEHFDEDGICDCSGEPV